MFSSSPIVPQTKLARLLQRFKQDEEGSIAIETVIILPVMFWALLSTFAIFDAYRQHAINQKAAYTIGDMISRETEPLDAAYLNGAQELLEYLTLTSDGETSIRVTSVKYDEEDDSYERDWSQSLGWVPPLGNNDVRALHDRLPVMPDNERVVVVETFVQYQPPFDTGLADHDIVNFVFTRPRYAPQVLWEN